MFQSRMRQFGILTWRQRVGVVLGITFALALAVGLIILSLTLALILLPVVVVAILIARWRLGRALAEAQPNVAGRPRDGRSRVRIIDAEFEVVDKDDRRG